MELPPRARRILLTSGFNLHRSGTTSACAENTNFVKWVAPVQRNYLRVRGEYHTPSVPHQSPWELPPRARRILVRGFFQLGGEGTTSACAENTLNALGLL